MFGSHVSPMSHMSPSCVSYVSPYSLHLGRTPLLACSYFQKDIAPSAAPNDAPTAAPNAGPSTSPNYLEQQTWFPQTGRCDSPSSHPNMSRNLTSIVLASYLHHTASYLHTCIILTSYVHHTASYCIILASYLHHTCITLVAASQ